jgi:hypothetical protein
VQSRYHQYPTACAYGEHASRELEAAKQRVDEILPYVSVFELKNVIFEPISPGTNEIFIVVSKHEEVHLQVGDNLQIVDESDERSMGTFLIRQVRQNDYYAIAVDIDSAWEGYIRQEARREQYPPMNAVARLIRRSI